MSLYLSLREELLERLATTEKSVKAELAGFLSAKRLPSFKIKVDSSSAARKLCRYLDFLGERYLLRSLDGGEYEVSLERFPGFAKDPLVYLGDELIWGDFLRGLFWGCGSMVKPWKGYHLEIGVASLELALGIKEALSDRGIGVSIRQKNGRCYLRFRDISSIRSVLKAMGAERSLRRLEKIGVVRKLRERANREANCDMANAGRIAMASFRDRMLLSKLGDRIDKLPDRLREVAELRIRYPSLSLSEIGSMLNPPASKMSVYRALNRIKRYIKDWREGEDLVFRKSED